MFVRIFSILFLFLASASLGFSQVGSEPEGARDFSSQQTHSPNKTHLSLQQLLTEWEPAPSASGFNRFTNQPIHLSPAAPQASGFWEMGLLIFGLSFLLWLIILIVGLAATGTAATVGLGLAAATAAWGVTAFCIALFCLIMILTREKRRENRRQYFRRFKLF